MLIEKLLIVIFSIISVSESYILRKYLKSFAESKLIKPDCTGICPKPYDIKVYTDQALKAKLKECGYTEGTDIFNFALSAIKKHNLYRACHNAQPLMLNCELSQIAQNHSQYYSENNKINNSFCHYNGQLISGQLTKFNKKTITGEAFTEGLYEKIIYYNFNNPENSTISSRSFAQLVWKNAEELGIGFVGKNGECIIGIYYFPPMPMPFSNLYLSQVQELQY